MEAMLRERKAMKVVKDMDGKGLEVRSVDERNVKKGSNVKPS